MSSPSQERRGRHRKKHRGDEEGGSRRRRSRSHRGRRRDRQDGHGTQPPMDWRGPSGGGAPPPQDWRGPGGWPGPPPGYNEAPPGYYPPPGWHGQHAPMGYPPPPPPGAFGAPGGQAGRLPGAPPADWRGAAAGYPHAPPPGWGAPPEAAAGFPGYGGPPQADNASIALPASPPAAATVPAPPAAEAPSGQPGYSQAPPAAIEDSAEGGLGGREEPLPPAPTAAERLKGVPLVTAGLSERMVAKLKALGLLGLEPASSGGKPLSSSTTPASELGPPQSGEASTLKAQCDRLGLSFPSSRPVSSPAVGPARLPACTAGLAQHAGLWERFRQRCGTLVAADAQAPPIPCQVRPSGGGGQVVAPLLLPTGAGPTVKAASD